MHKRYSNGDITVTWKPELCRHTGICARGLPLVFNPSRRPWVQLEHADSATVSHQVDRCPSGALTWTRTNEPS
jgi:putative redox protein